MELIDFHKYEKKALLKYIQGICFRQLILVFIFFYFFIVYGQVDIGGNIIIQNFQQFVVQDICRDLLLKSRLENNGDTMERTSVVGLESIVAIHTIKRNKKYKSNLQKTQNVKIGKCYKTKIGKEYGKRATLLLNGVNALQKNKYYKIQFSNRIAAIGNFSIWQEMIFPNSIFIQISPRILTTYPKASNERMILHQCIWCFIIRPPPYLSSTIA